MTRKQQTFAEQIRHLIETSGQTCYRIGKETGVDTATLSRFINKKAGLSMPNLNALAEYLGWTIVVEKKPRKQKGE